jgi:hypothetical protein
MGFRAEVENFQPFYVHAKARQRELRVGAAMLGEAMTREEEKSKREQTVVANERQSKQSASEKVIIHNSISLHPLIRSTQVKLNFEDDRREKQLRDQMERERREAKARADAQAAANNEKRQEKSDGAVISGATRMGKLKLSGQSDTQNNVETDGDSHPSEEEE